MRSATLILLVSLFLVAPSSWAQDSPELLVISAHPEIDTLSRSELKQIYMETRSLRGLRPLHLAEGARARVVFNTRVIGLTESRIRAYWAQMRFTGRGSPPEERDSIDEILSAIQRDTSYVAYVPGGTALPDGVRVLYRVGADR